MWLQRSSNYDSSYVLFRVLIKKVTTGWYAPTLQRYKEMTWFSNDANRHVAQADSASDVTAAETANVDDARTRATPDKRALSCGSELWTHIMRETQNRTKRTTSTLVYRLQ